MSLFYGYQEKENKPSDSDDLKRKIVKLEKRLNGIRFNRVFNYTGLDVTIRYPTQAPSWPQSPISLTNPSNEATLRIVSLTLDNDDKVVSKTLSSNAVIQIGVFVVYADGSDFTTKLYNLYNIDHNYRTIKTYKIFQLDIDIVLSDIINNVTSVQYLFPYLQQVSTKTYGFECSLVLQYTDEG